MSQDNLPVVQFAQGPTNLPAEVMSSMTALYDDAFAGFGGMADRRIKVGKVGFILQDGGNQETVPFDRLYGVFVGAAPTNHAVWYEREYTPGQEPEKPDLVWYMPTPETFPDALPVQFRKKVLRAGQERWAFKIMRRVAFVIVREVNGSMVLDLEKPYIMELSSMSLFGKGMPEQNLYKWSAIRDVCAQNSTPQLQVLPNMFLMRIVVDVNAPSGVVMFSPARQPNGQLNFLDTNLILAVHDIAQRQTTRDMLAIREKLSYTPSHGVTQTQDPSYLQTVVAPPQPVMQPQPVAQPFVPPFMAQPATTATVPQAQAPTAQTIASPPDMNNLLSQAAQILAQGAPAGQTAQPQTVSSPQPPAAPVPADASVQASITNLMSQLG